MFLSRDPQNCPDFSVGWKCHQFFSPLPPFPCVSLNRYRRAGALPPLPLPFSLCPSLCPLPRLCMEERRGVCSSGVPCAGRGGAGSRRRESRKVGAEVQPDKGFICALRRRERGGRFEKRFESWASDRVFIGGVGKLPVWCSSSAGDGFIWRKR